MKPHLSNPARYAAALASLALAGCSSLPDAATSALTGSTGAYLGHELGGGRPEGALLGAASGVAAGALLNRSRERAKKKSYRSGYDAGRNDEVKRLYWARKRLHQEGGFGTAGLTPSLYEIPVPGHVASDGTLIEPHTQVIEVLEP